MELEQIKIMKTDLEHSLCKQVRDFEIITGTYVSSIDHNTASVAEMGRKATRKTVSVELTVEIR